MIGRVVVRLFILTLAAPLSLARAPLKAQTVQDSQNPPSEIVVNLATGKVVVAVWKDALVIGTVANPIETGTRLPLPVQLSDSHAAVILGAVDWIDPDSGRELARLDRELPDLHGHGPSGGPHLGSPEGMEARDIETVGDGLLERLNDLARDFHSKIETPDGMPFVQMIFAGYVPNYGAEVWRLDYGVQQTEQAAGYWATRVSRPSYIQLWPPEKGAPHTLIEVAYPREEAGQAILDLLRANDPRLEKISAADPQMATVARAVVNGETNKVKHSEAAQFFRAALDATSSPNAQESIAMLEEEAGFKWVLAPPAEPKAPAVPSNRPPGAPSLRHPSQ